MERNREQPSTMADASGRIYVNQRARAPTSNETSIPVLRNNITLVLRPSYPLTTTNHEEGVYLAEYSPEHHCNSNETVSCSSPSVPFPSHSISPPTLRRNIASLSPMRNHISNEHYERIVQENKRLKLELESAHEAVESATKACRDLAAWTIWERNRLMGELDQLKEAHRAFINGEVDLLIAEETDHLPSNH